VASNDDRDAFGRRHRATGNHKIGDSRPGTVGDAERILHERQGQLPTIDRSAEVPSESHEQETEEKTTADGVDIDDLVVRL